MHKFCHAPNKSFFYYCLKHNIISKSFHKSCLPHIYTPIPTIRLPTNALRVRSTRSRLEGEAQVPIIRAGSSRALLNCPCRVTIGGSWRGASSILLLDHFKPALRACPVFFKFKIYIIIYCISCKYTFNEPKKTNFPHQDNRNILMKFKSIIAKFIVRFVY